MLNSTLENDTQKESRPGSGSGKEKGPFPVSNLGDPKGFSGASTPKETPTPQGS